jgi:hypothetical protein
MRHLEDADRAEDERARELRSENVDGGLAGRDVPEHARDDPPALESLAVPAHCVLAARAPGDVRVPLWRHRGLRSRLELVHRDRDRRIRPARPRDVHLELALPPDADGHRCTLTAAA